MLWIHKYVENIISIKVRHELFIYVLRMFLASATNASLDYPQIQCVRVQRNIIKKLQYEFGKAVRLWTVVVVVVVQHPSIPNRPFWDEL